VAAGVAEAVGMDVELLEAGATGGFASAPDDRSPLGGWNGLRHSHKVLDFPSFAERDTSPKGHLAMSDPDYGWKGFSTVRVSMTWPC